MLKSEQCEITISKPETITDKYYVIMDILCVNINLETMISTPLLNAYIFFQQYCAGLIEYTVHLSKQ